MIIYVKTENLPTVSERTYKEPEYLQYPNNRKKLEEYWKWDTHINRRVCKKEINNLNYFAVEYIDDIFASYDKGPWQYAYSQKRTERKKKYPAIGGPKDGQLITIDRPDEYIQYNCGIRGDRSGYPTCVLIHKV